jgi:hypothetical protein
MDTSSDNFVSDELFVRPPSLSEASWYNKYDGSYTCSGCNRITKQPVGWQTLFTENPPLTQMLPEIFCAKCSMEWVPLPQALTE